MKAWEVAGIRLSVDSTWLAVPVAVQAEEAEEAATILRSTLLLSFHRLLVVGGGTLLLNDGFGIIDSLVTEPGFTQPLLTVL